MTGQVRAIKAQEDIGSAEREGQKIRATTISQWQSMITEMQRFVKLLGAMGGESSFLATMSDGLKTVAFAIALMNDQAENGMVKKLLDGSGIPLAWKTVGLGQVGGLIDYGSQGGGQVQPEARARRHLLRAGARPRRTRKRRRASAEEAEQLSRRSDATGRTNGFGNNALRNATTMGLAVPAGQRDAFSRELQAAIERKDVEAAVAVLKIQQAQASERAADFAPAGNPSSATSWPRRSSGRLPRPDGRWMPRKAKGLDTGSEEATRTRLENESRKSRVARRSGPLARSTNRPTTR